MNRFEQMVQQAVHDELEAASFYAAMAAQAPNAEIRSVVMSIAGDEYNHARTLSSITGMEVNAVSPYETEAYPTGRQFLDDVRMAVQGELVAISDYGEIARQAPNDEIRMIVLSIAGDEYGHARTFLTILALSRPGAMEGGFSGGLG